MFLKVVLVVIISIVVSTECREFEMSPPRKGIFVTFKGPGYVEKCPDEPDPIFEIGDLKSTGLKYDDINQHNTLFTIEGLFKNKNLDHYVLINELFLDDYFEKDGYKQFATSVKDAGNDGFKVRINKKGLIQLTTHVKGESHNSRCGSIGTIEFIDIKTYKK